MQESICFENMLKEVLVVFDEAVGGYSPTNQLRLQSHW